MQRSTQDTRYAQIVPGLAIVEDSLHTALLAVLAVHPMLAAPSRPHEPPSLRSARRLFATASTFAFSLDRYRGAVLDALGPLPSSPDDIVFWPILIPAKALDGSSTRSVM